MKTPANKTSPQVAASIVRRYLGSPKVTVARIAADHGVDPATAHAVLTRAGVKRRHDVWLPKLDDLAAAERELVRRGEAVTGLALARVLGCSPAKVRRLRAERGDMPATVEPHDAAEWARRYRKGESIRSLAATERRNVSIIGAALAALGVEMRSRGRQPKPHSP